MDMHTIASISEGDESVIGECNSPISLVPYSEYMVSRSDERTQVFPKGLADSETLRTPMTRRTVKTI